MRKKSLLLSIFLVLVSLFYTGFVSAELDLKITGVINDYSSDVYLKTNTAASSSLDAYDMPTPSSPSKYASFYSDITTGSLSIDSWNYGSTSRTVDLVYTVSDAQTGDLSLSWNSAAASDYDIKLKYYGTDSSYTSQVGSDVDMGSSSSYSNSLSSNTNIYVRVVVSPKTTTTTTASSSGSSGGGGGGATTEGLIISNSLIEVYTALNEIKIRKIDLYNSGSTPMTININAGLLKKYIDIKESSFTLAPGERKSVEIRVIASEEAGVYTDKIYVNNKPVYLILNVHTKDLLFDAGISIPESFKMISAGDKLESQITLIPMGDAIRLDVTLNYIIKDFEGRTFLTESETILVDSQKNFKKDFSNLNLPPGKYVVALELIYPNGVATSSSNFEVKGAEFAPLLGPKSLIIIFGIGILIIIIAIVFVLRRNKKIKIHKKR